LNQSADVPRVQFALACNFFFSLACALCRLPLFVPNFLPPRGPLPSPPGLLHVRVAPSRRPRKGCSSALVSLFRFHVILWLVYAFSFLFIFPPPLATQPSPDALGRFPPPFLPILPHEKNSHPRPQALSFPRGHLFFRGAKDITDRCPFSLSVSHDFLSPRYFSSIQILHFSVKPPLCFPFSRELLQVTGQTSVVSSTQLPSCLCPFISQYCLSHFSSESFFVCPRSLGCLHLLCNSPTVQLSFSFPYAILFINRPSFYY